MAYQKLTPIVATGATEPRYLGDRFADMVNVRDFGATGDGTTDDTAAFAAAAAAAAGRAVFVPQGSYNVDPSGLSGTFVSDGFVDAGGLKVYSINGNNDFIDLLKTSMSFSAPSQRFAFPHYLSVDSPYAIQSVCYDTKRECFLLGIENATDNTQSGYIKRLTDILDPSSVTDSESVGGGHFNDMAYDSDNDAVYICPGSSQPNTLLVVNPSTLAISQTVSMDATMWQASVKDGYLYAHVNGVIQRYSTSNFAKDTGFSGIPIRQNDNVAPNETITDQGSFICGDVFVLIRCVSSNEATEWAGISRRIVYDCVNIKTGNNVRVSFPCSVYNEIECADIKDGVLYQVAIHENIVDVYVSPLGTIYNGAPFDKSIAAVAGTAFDIKNFNSPGKYLIHSSTVLSSLAPDLEKGWVLSCGFLKVEDLCVDGAKRHTLKLRNGGSFVYQQPSMTATEEGEWFQEGYFSPYVGQASDTVDNCANVPGCHCFSSVTGLPAGTNGWVVTYGAGNAAKKNSYHVFKQIYYRWGTPGSSDHSTYIRTGIRNDNQQTSWGSWVQIITGNDSFPNNFCPSTDNNKKLGDSSKRWSQVYAGSGSINTSDLRTKENLASPDEKLMKAWGRVGYKVFQFKDAVEQKGTEARLHIGVVAQEVAEAFAAEGLDANRYGLFCYDEWDDKFDEDVVVDEEALFDEEGNEIAPAKTHTVRTQVQKAGSLYGIRYDEALALECAYQRWRIEKLEERVNQLTSQNNK